MSDLNGLLQIGFLRCRCRAWEQFLIFRILSWQTYLLKKEIGWHILVISELQSHFRKQSAEVKAISRRESNMQREKRDIQGVVNRMGTVGNLFILGDSYSTFEGYIPEGYAAYYTRSGREETDVTRVEETWWYQVIQETQANLLLNSSWSGTTICNTGYEGKDFSDISFITRLDQLIEAGYFEENHVDTLLVFGGTNDTWSDAPLGERKYEGWTRADLYCVLPAVGYLFNRLKTKLKDTRVLCIINTELKREIHEGMKAACAKYDVEVIELQEIVKICGHPTILGMKQIAEQVRRCL